MKINLIKYLIILYIKFKITGQIYLKLHSIFILQKMFLLMNNINTVMFPI